MPFQQPLRFPLRPRRILAPAGGPAALGVFPVIRVDSNGGGSDTNNSGAGPGDGVYSGSAITSTTISTDATGTVVTIPNADLSAVNTDGSHAVTISDATPTARNFSKIIGKGNSGASNAYVAVPPSEAFTANLAASQTGGIGGKRLTIGGTNSTKLFSNNSGAGDAMPGWAVEMLSGHTETISASYLLRRSGDTISGPIILRGVSDAATLPVLTFNNNGTAIDTVNVDQIQLRDFELRNSNASKTSAVAISLASTGSSENVVIRGIKCASQANPFGRFLTCPSTSNGTTIEDCEIAWCTITSGAISITQSLLLYLANCHIHDNAGNGLQVTATGAHFVVIGNVFARNGGDGVSITGASVHWFTNNTFDGNANGIEITTSGAGAACFVFNSNIFSNNIGYGINFSAAAHTAVWLYASGFTLRNNCFFNNTSGKYNPPTLTISENEQITDPQYVDRASGDYRIGANLRADGYPLGGTLPIGKSSTYSYVDIGAVQRQEKPMAEYQLGV